MAWLPSDNAFPGPLQPLQP